MPTLLPYRNYNDHDINQMFTYNRSGISAAVKGTFVKIFTGVSPNQSPLEMLGAFGNAWPNTVSQRYGITSQVTACTNSGDSALGVLLYDTRETDENGLPLIYNKEKQDKMQVSLSGEPTPVLSRGVVLYSGVEGALPTNPGETTAYLGIAGGVTTSGNAIDAGKGLVTRIGRFLGPANSQGHVYLKLEL